MASGNFTFSQKTKLNFFSATNVLNPANTFKLALVKSTWTPAPTTDEVWADVSANEISAGNGYTANGNVLAGVTLSQTGGVVTFTSNATVFTANGGSIPAWYYGVVFASGTLNAKVNPLVGYFLGDSTPANVPATTANNTLTITMNANGIVSAN